MMKNARNRYMFRSLDGFLVESQSHYNFEQKSPEEEALSRLELAVKKIQYQPLLLDYQNPNCLPPLQNIHENSNHFVQRQLTEFIQLCENLDIPVVEQEYYYAYVSRDVSLRAQLIDRLRASLKLLLHFKTLKQQFDDSVQKLTQLLEAESAEAEPICQAYIDSARSSVALISLTAQINTQFQNKLDILQVLQPSLKADHLPLLLDKTRFIDMSEEENQKQLNQIQLSQADLIQLVTGLDFGTEGAVNPRELLDFCCESLQIQPFPPNPKSLSEFELLVEEIIVNNHLIRQLENSQYKLLEMKLLQSSPAVFVFDPSFSYIQFQVPTIDEACESEIKLVLKQVPETERLAELKKKNWIAPKHIVEQEAQRKQIFESQTLPERDSILTEMKQPTEFWNEPRIALPENPRSKLLKIAEERETKHQMFLQKLENDRIRAHKFQTARWTRYAKANEDAENLIRSSTLAQDYVKPEDRDKKPAPEVAEEGQEGDAPLAQLEGLPPTDQTALDSNGDPNTQEPDEAQISKPQTTAQAPLQVVPAINAPTPPPPPPKEPSEDLFQLQDEPENEILPQEPTPQPEQTEKKHKKRKAKEPEPPKLEQQASLSISIAQAEQSEVVKKAQKQSKEKPEDLNKIQTEAVVEEVKKKHKKHVEQVELYGELYKTVDVASQPLAASIADPESVKKKKKKAKKTEQGAAQQDDDLELDL